MRLTSVLLRDTLASKGPPSPDLFEKRLGIAAPAARAAGGAAARLISADGAFLSSLKDRSVPVPSPVANYLKPRTRSRRRVRGCFPRRLAGRASCKGFIS